MRDAFEEILIQSSIPNKIINLCLMKANIIRNKYENYYIQEPISFKDYEIMGDRRV